MSQINVSVTDGSPGQSVVTVAGPSAARVSVAGANAGGVSVASGAVLRVNGQQGNVVLSASSVTAAAALHALQHNTGGSDPLANLVTSVSLTASANNYQLPVGDIFRLSHSQTVALQVTGLAASFDGDAKLIVNVSTGASSSITISHENTNSSAANRLRVPWEGDYVVAPKGGAALVIYDSADLRWRVV